MTRGGRLSELRINGVLKAQYRHDFAGRQAVRTLTSTTQTIHSVFDSAGNRIAEYDQTSGALLREYVWNGLTPVAVIENGVVYFVRVDHIGRPVFATNAAGAKVWTATYTPFGEVHVSTGTPIALRFPGQWFQSESGLHQNWMRDYDPTTGRYLEADPLGLVDGASVYGYAGQNPMMNMDPTGECIGPLAYVCAAAAGAVISIAINWLLDPDCYTFEEAIEDALWGAAGGAAFRAAGVAWGAWRGAGAAAAGSYSVYIGLTAEGVPAYVGSTSRTMAICAAEHSASSAAKAALQYQVVNGATGLTREAARILEQKLINQYGGSVGRQLLNRINSIAPKYWAQYGIPMP
jgi:RHS repeat-associated protein